MVLKKYFLNTYTNLFSALFYIISRVKINIKLTDALLKKKGYYSFKQHFNFFFLQLPVAFQRIFQTYFML